MGIQNTYSFCIHIFTLLFFNSFAQGKCKHVFIQFAENKIGKNFSSKMPKNWETKVAKATNSWDGSEMKKFLNFLISRIGKEATREIMKKDLRSFSRANLSELEKVVQFIEIYIEEEAVKEKIKIDLGSFLEVTLNQLKEKEKEWRKQKIKDYGRKIQFTKFYFLALKNKVKIQLLL